MRANQKAEDLKSIASETFKIACGTVHGAFDGLIGTVKTWSNPVGNIFYPMAELAYHSVVLLGHRAAIDDDDPEIRAAMSQLLAGDDTIMPATHAYFEQRGQQLNHIVQHFKDADPQEKARMIGKC